MGQVESSGWAVMYVQDAADTKFDFELLIHPTIVQETVHFILGYHKACSESAFKNVLLE